MIIHLSLCLRASSGRGLCFLQLVVSLYTVSLGVPGLPGPHGFWGFLVLLRATTSLEAVPDHGAVLGGGRSSGQLLCSLRRLFSPFSHPGGVFSVPGRLSSGSGLAPRGRGEACQRSLGNHPRSGPSFPVVSS